MEEIDHEHTEEIVCPYCGSEEKNSYTYSDEGYAECGECGKEFEFYRKFLGCVYYTSKVE